MRNSIFTQTAKFLQERRNNRRWRRTVLCLSFLIVCGTGWGLLQKGHAMTRLEGDLDCQYEIHRHSEECFLDGKLICGKVEYVVHTHDEICYNIDGELMCQLPEETGHIHEDGCFEIEKELVCDLGEEEAASTEKDNSTDTLVPAEEKNVTEEEETEEEIIYEVKVDTASEESHRELICGLEEHTHDEGCYKQGESILICDQSETEGHSHDDGCYTTDVIQICGLEEGEEGHIHDDTCFSTSTILVCGQSETEGHSHDDSCFETVGEELVCDKEEHVHIDACYVEVPEEVSQAPADGQNTSEIADDIQNETEVTDDVQNENEVTDELEKDSAVHEHDDSCYRIVRKYLVCEKEGIHIHDDSCWQDEELICEAPVVQVLEEHEHDQECFRIDEEITSTKIFKNDDILVTVTYQNSAKIPENAEFQVEEVTQEDELAVYGQQLEETSGILEEGEKLTALIRMGFYTEDEIFVPSDKVKLTVEFLNDSIYAEDDERKAVCIQEDGVSLISGENGLITLEAEELPELAFVVAEEEEQAPVLTYEGEDYVVTVVLKEDSTLSEDARLVVEKITEMSDPAHYEQRLGELEGTEGLLDENETIAMLLNMWILADGEEIPLSETADVTVRFLNNDFYFEGDTVKAVCFTDRGVDLLSTSNTDHENATTFEVDELAEYGFLTMSDIRTMTCEGDGFEVTVRFGKTAEIPEEAVLKAERYTQEEDSEFIAEHEDKLREQVEETRIALNMLMEVGFYVDGEEIEPKDTVDVKIKLLDKEGLEGDSSFRVVHFAEHGIEVLEGADVEDEGNSLSTSFQLDSFSVLGLGRDLEGKIKDARSFYDAIQNADENDVIELDGSFDFPGETGLGAPELGVGHVTLNLNGYTITLNNAKDPEANITLIDVRNSSGKQAELTIIDEDRGTGSYNAAEKMTSVSYMKTEVNILNQKTGQTSVETKAYETSGGAVVGNGANEYAMFYVDGGTLTIKGGIMTGNGGRVVEASNGATLNLEGGYLVNNDSVAHKKDGGAVCGENGTTINIRGDIVFSGNKGFKGGAVKADNATVNMEGGYITNNRSENTTGENAWDGGGIRVCRSTLTISDGYITGNTAKGVGGGVFVEYGTLNLEGGYISGNVAEENEGGGIAIYCTATAYIGSANSQKKIYITDNVSSTVQDWGGGGMFINQDATVYLYNTLITNNEAQGFGGGIGGCATGRIIETDPMQGAAVFDNRAIGTARAGAASVKHQDSEYTDNNPAFWDKGADGKYLFEDYFCALYSNIANGMLGGGIENWDGSIDGRRINRAADNWQSSYIIGLTAYPAETDKSKAIDAAKVYINGNSSSTHGGGIMCNGVLVIGASEDAVPEIEITSRIELRAKKELIDGSGNPISMKDGQFGFAVYSDEACTRLVATGKNDAGGKIEFGFLSFNLKEDLLKDTPPLYDADSDAYQYCYYVKEEPLTGIADNLGIVTDENVYRMTITVRKSDHGVVNGVQKYRDDIVRIKVETGKIVDGSYIPEELIYEDLEDNIEDPDKWNHSKYSDETHPIVISLTKDGIIQKDWMGEDKPESCEPFDKLGDNTFVNIKEETTEIIVEKHWDDVKLTKKDSVTIELYQNDKVYENAGQIVLNNDNEWKGGWSNLPAKDADGKPYEYKVKEIDTSKGKITDYDVTYDYQTKGSVTEVIITNTPKAFQIKLVKNDEEGNPLARAGFEIAERGKTLKFIQNNGEYILYEEESNSHGEEDSAALEVFTTLYTDVDGRINVSGLHAGTYTLKEVKAPFGYKEVETHTITLSEDTDSKVVVSSKADEKPDAEFQDDMHTLLLTLIDQVKIYVLPETGGVGTRIFYIIGSVMVLGSGILLITRKRMNSKNRRSSK